MFMWRKKRGVKKDDDDLDGNDSEETGSSHEEEVHGEVPGGDSNKYEWAKKVNPDLWRYIETKACRRDINDEYFDNPTNRKGMSIILFVYILLILQY